MISFEGLVCTVSSSTHLLNSTRYAELRDASDLTLEKLDVDIKLEWMAESLKTHAQIVAIQNRSDRALYVFVEVDSPSDRSSICSKSVEVLHPG